MTPEQARERWRELSDPCPHHDDWSKGCGAAIPACWATLLCRPCAREDCEHDEVLEDPNGQDLRVQP